MELTNGELPVTSCILIVKVSFVLSFVPGAAQIITIAFLWSFVMWQH